MKIILMKLMNQTVRENVLNFVLNVMKIVNVLNMEMNMELNIINKVKIYVNNKLN